LRSKPPISPRAYYATIVAVALGIALPVFLWAGMQPERRGAELLTLLFPTAMFATLLLGVGWWATEMFYLIRGRSRRGRVVDRFARSSDDEGRSGLGDEAFVLRYPRWVGDGVIALGVVMALAISIPAAWLPPGAKKNEVAVGPALAFLLMFVTPVVIALKRMPMARVDAVGIWAHAPRPGGGLRQHFFKTLLPWSEVASYRRIERLDIFGRSSPARLVFLDERGHERRTLGLMSFSARDRERLMAHLQDRFPLKVSGPEEADLTGEWVVPSELYVGTMIVVALGAGLVANPLLSGFCEFWGLGPPKDAGALGAILVPLCLAMVEGLFRALGISPRPRIESRGRATLAPSQSDPGEAPVEVSYPGPVGCLWALAPPMLGLSLGIGLANAGWRGLATSVVMMVIVLSALGFVMTFGTPVPYARADARGIRIYRPLRGWLQAQASWDDVASCDITTSSSFGQAAVSWATLKDREGKPLLTLNLAQVRPDDRHRLLDYLRSRLPKTYAGALDE
jgi:hypothetical protein